MQKKFLGACPQTLLVLVGTLYYYAVPSQLRCLHPASKHESL